MKPPLPHVYPMWESPEDDPGGELREVWVGKMRIVRNRKRMRKLRRRGVPLMDLRAKMVRGYVGPHEWAWFVEDVPAGTKLQVIDEAHHFVDTSKTISQRMREAGFTSLRPRSLPPDE